MKNSTFTCDGCEGELTPDEAEKHMVLTVTSQSIDGGTKDLDLCSDCEDKFMDGSLSGADLLLQD